MPFMLSVTNPTAGMSGFVNELDKGGAVDNKGGIITATGNTWPAVTGSPEYTIPLRTPFTLTGSATDAEGDSLLYSWEQNDRGNAGTTLLTNGKLNGPLFAMFPKSGQISLGRRAALRLAGPEPPDERSEPHVPGPAADHRQQHERRHGLVPAGCADRTAGAAGGHRVLLGVPADLVATSASPGRTRARSRCTSASPRVTARAASTRPTRRCCSRTPPARSSSPSSPASWPAGSTQTVTWDVAGTNARAGQHGEREDLAVDRRRAHVPVGAGGEHAERRLARRCSSRTRRRRTPASRSRRSGTSTSTSRTRTSRSRSRASSGSTRSAFSGSNPIDSYNSAAGPYGGANKGATRACSRTARHARPVAGRRRRCARRSPNVVLGGGGLDHGQREGRHHDHERRDDPGHEDAQLAVADAQPEPGGGLLAVQRPRRSAAPRATAPRPVTSSSAAARRSRSRPARTASATSRSRAPAR